MVTQSHLCQSCGTNPGDWLDDEGKDRWPAPHIPQGIRCMGCVTLKEERDKVEKDDDVEREGLFITLIPNPEFEEDDG